MSETKILQTFDAVKSFSRTHPANGGMNKKSTYRKINEMKSNH